MNIKRGKSNLIYLVFTSLTVLQYSRVLAYETPEIIERNNHVREALIPEN